MMHITQFPTCGPFSQTWYLSSSHAAAEEQLTHDKHSDARSQWPMKFDFPVEKLHSQVHEALDKPDRQ